MLLIVVFVAILFLFTPLLTFASFGSAFALTSSTKVALPSEMGPAGATANGHFGYAVAMSGTIIVIGARDENSSGLRFAGNAYVFNAKTGAIIYTLKDPNAQAAGEFGSSVAISGTTIVVGAPGDSSSDGKAYSFSSTTGRLIKTLSSPNAQSDGAFGTSVAIGGGTIIVGAPGEKASGDNLAGHVYTFNASSGVHVKTLNSPNTVSGGAFGTSVATNGTTLVVGAPFENTPGNVEAGRAYTFSISSGTLLKTLADPNSAEAGNFGAAVAINGTTIVVGAPFDPVSAKEGAAYVFSASTGKLSKTLMNPNSSGQFGASVGTNGTAAVVGAPYETVSSDSDAGSAYTFTISTGTLLKTLKSPHVQAEGEFGTSVAISGSTALVGAPLEAASGYGGGGNAYTFGASTGALIKSFKSPVTTLRSPNAVSGGTFGTSVAMGGGRIVVGAPGENGGGGNAYTFSQSTGALVATLKDPSAQPSEFGMSVAVSGTTVVVGAPGETASGDADAGNAYVFNATNGKLISTLTDPNPVIDGGFGTSVAVSGTTVVVGALGDTFDTQTEAGLVYTFNSVTGKLLETVDSPNAIAGGNFGAAVAISGTTIVIGAVGETVSSMGDAGNTYTFNAATGKLIDTLKDPNAQGGGELGTSVAISGNVIAVGAVFEDSSAGNAYTFNATTGALKNTLSDPNSQSGGQFGISVAVSGNTVVVGAWGENSLGYGGAGNAYTYSFSTGKLISTLTSPDAQANGEFGTWVAVSGATIVIGAPGENSATGYTYIV